MVATHAEIDASGILSPTTRLLVIVVDMVGRRTAIFRVNLNAADLVRAFRQAPSLTIAAR